VRRSIYEELECDRMVARRASLKAVRKRVELLTLSSHLAALRVQFELINLKCALPQEVPTRPAPRAGRQSRWRAMDEWRRRPSPRID
jgi:hypothetical protein